MVLSHFTFLDTGWWHHTRPHQLATGAMPLASRLRAPRRARTHAASTLRYLRALSSWPLLTTEWHDKATVDTCIGPRHPLKIGSRQPQIVPIPNSANLRSHWPPPIVSNVAKSITLALIHFPVRIQLSPGGFTPAHIIRYVRVNFLSNHKCMDGSYHWILNKLWSLIY